MPMNENKQFTVHHLRFEVEALTPLVLPAYAGPSIRGALFGALKRHFCPVPQSETPDTAHTALCPVCWLMATDKPGYRTGRDVPRPYTVEPPVRASSGSPPTGRGEPWRHQPGDRFGFGLTLFAQALNLFPYLVVATPLMGQTGIGVPLAENAPRRGDRRRGQFALRRIEAVNPVRGEVATVMGEGQTMVQMPDVPVRAIDVEAARETIMNQLGARGRVQLRFWTPTRIVDQGRLVHRPRLEPLVRRLLERLDALRGEYAGEPPVPDRERLLALADEVRLVQDSTRWLEVKSRSRRLKRSTHVSGFVGTATYEASAGTWTILLPYLLWGQATHVGKNATKGDGWYEVRGVEGG
jgi:hypothetical protein